MFFKAKNFVTDGSKTRKLKVIYWKSYSCNYITTNVAMQNLNVNSRKDHFYLLKAFCELRKWTSCTRGT